MPATEEANLYRLAIAYVFKHQAVIEAKWHEHIQFVISGIVTGQVENTEVAHWFWDTHIARNVDRSLVDFLREQGVEPLKMVRPGYSESIREVAQSHIYSLIRSLFFHWKNRYYYQARMVELSNTELFEYLMNGPKWWQYQRFDPKPDDIRQFEWFKQARSMFFAKYQDELEIAKDTKWYDWVVSEAAVRLYIHGGNGKAGYHSMNPYAWMWAKLCEVMADGWPSERDDNYEQAS